MRGASAGTSKIESPVLGAMEGSMLGANEGANVGSPGSGVGRNVVDG